MSQNLGNNRTWNFVDAAPTERFVDSGDKKTYYMLVNEDGQNISDVIFGDNTGADQFFYMDWDLDGNGFIRSISNEDAMIQTTLKCLFTEKQLSGYGTHVYDFVGEKDMGVRRLAMFMDISMALLTLKNFIDAEAIRQDLNPNEIIATVSNLAVTEDQTDVSVVKVQLKLLPASGVEVPVTVL